MTIASRLSAALGGRYRVEREIGAGGMAIIFQAVDLKHDRLVALKVLRPELAAALGADRFLQEIRIAARLEHPHILTLIDSGAADDLLYYVLPFVRGESLRDRLAREHQLGIDEALAVARQVASALAYAHAHGVVHRDVKPENILLHEGEATLTDFGIALAVRQAGGARFTATGVSLGTPQYMSPEQAAGDREVDGRSDIFSLGAVTYEMLTGEAPHAGSTVAAVIARVLTERPTNPRVLRSTVSEQIDRTVMKALEKAPADRYRTAREFAAALAGGDIAGATGADTPAAPRRARRAAIAGVTTLITAAGTVAIYLEVSRGHATHPLPAPFSYDIVQITATGQATFPTISQDGSQLAYLNRTCSASASCRSSVVIHDLASGAERTLVDDIGWGFPARFSSDDAWLLIDGVDIASGMPAGQYVIPRVGGPLTFVGAGRGDLVPSGDTVLIASAGDAPATIRFREVPLPIALPPDTTQSRSHGSLGEIDDVRVSPNGRRVAVLWEPRSGQDVVVLYDRRGARSDSTTVPASAGFTLTWSPGGTAVLAQVRSARGDAAVLRLAVSEAGRFGPRDTVVLTPGRRQVAGMDVAGTGHGIVYATRDAGEHTLWALERSAPGAPPRPLRRVRSTTAGVAAAISMDGKVLVYGVAVPGAAAPSTQIFVQSFEGGSERALTPPLAEVLNWIPTLDDRRVIVATREQGLRARLTAYDLATGRASALGEATTQGQLAEYGRDGVAVLSASSDTVRLLDGTGHEQGRIVIPDSLGYPWAMTAAPDGHELAFLTLRSDSVSGELAARQPFYRVPVTGRARLIAWFEYGSEMLNPFEWSSDGWIYFGALAAGSRQPMLWRVRADGGSAHPVSALPFAPDPCVCMMSADGRRWVGVVSRPVSDIYLIRNLDLDRR